MSLARLLNPAPRGDAQDDDARSIDIGSQDSESICSEEEYTDQDDGDSGHGYYSEEQDDDEGGLAESFVDDGPAHSYIDDGERIAEEGEGAAREHRSAPPQLSGTLVNRWREREVQSGAPPQPWAPRTDAFTVISPQPSTPGPSSRREAVERWIAAGGGEMSEAGYGSAPEQARGVREEEVKVTRRDKGKGKAGAPPKPWGSVRAESFGKDSVEPEPEPVYHRPPLPPWLAGREAAADAPELGGPILPEARAAPVWIAPPRIKVRSPSPEAGSSATLEMIGSMPPEVKRDASESGGSSGSSPLIDVAHTRRTSVSASTVTKDGQRSPCKFCEKTFNRPTDALRHMKTVHEDPEDGEWSLLNTCCVCGKKLARPDSLKRHCDARHGGAGPPPKRRRGESGSGSAGSMV